jgi:hypothetical protein
MSISVTHVVQHGHTELLVITSLLGGLEAHDLRLGGAIGSSNLVVVSGARVEFFERNLVEEFTALGDSLDLGARWSAAVSIQTSY